MPRRLAEGERPLTVAERQARWQARRDRKFAAMEAALSRIQAARTIREAREIAAAALGDG